ncbi:MAG: diguanylate cyclase [Pseudomonadales bacterium]|nr:diguanylate cyclase [Pseudomonadales bacterium]
MTCRLPTNWTAACCRPITTSIGCSQVSAQDRNFEDVLKRADLALYRAKDAGRNRVVAH